MVSMPKDERCIEFNHLIPTFGARGNISDFVIYFT